jgi:uncharacterized membrane protein YdjX (TVP38/TMEM64 family)
MGFEKLSSGKGGRILRFWLLLGGAALLIGLVVTSSPFRNLAGEAIDWAEDSMNRHPVIGVAVFFVFSALSAMLAFASSVVLVPAASLAWGNAVTFFLLWGGWLAGAAAAFGIGRLAHPLLSHTGYEDKLEKYQQYVSQRMKFWAVVLFCVAIPSEIPGYLFGSMRYPFPKFLLAIAIAEAGYALGAVVAGESLLVNRPLPFMAVVALLALVAALAGVLLRTGKGHKPDGISPR